MEDIHARFMRTLEQHKHLNRAVERFPDDETITSRRNAGLGLTVPELAVLLAYAKITLKEQLLASPLPDDSEFIADLVRYFPTALRERFLERIRVHPLRAGDRRHDTRERARQPGRHDVRVPPRGGNRRNRARDRARARGRAGDLRPRRSVAGDRSPRLHPRRRRADDDVPRIAKARRASEQVAAPAPTPPAQRRGDRRILRGAGRPPDGFAPGVGARGRAPAYRPATASFTALGVPRISRRVSPRSTCSLPHSTSRSSPSRTRSRSNGSATCSVPSATGFVSTGSATASSSCLVPPLGRPGPERPAGGRRGRAPRDRRRDAPRRARRGRCRGRVRGVVGPANNPRSTARSCSSTTSPRRACSTSRRSPSRSGAQSARLNRCSVSRGRPRTGWSSPCRRRRTCWRGRCRHPAGGARTSS